jgi:TnpA family transposase
MNLILDKSITRQEFIEKIVPQLPENIRIHSGITEIGYVAKKYEYIEIYWLLNKTVKI